MKTIYRKTVSVFLLLAVTFVVIGTVAAEDSASISGSNSGTESISGSNSGTESISGNSASDVDLGANGASPVVDLSIRYEADRYAESDKSEDRIYIIHPSLKGQCVVYFIDNSKNTHNIECDFGDGTYGTYSMCEPTIYSHHSPFNFPDWEFIGTLHTYSPGIYTVKFTASNQYGNDTKANTLVINNDGNCVTAPNNTGSTIIATSVQTLVTGGIEPVADPLISKY
jgi:hypothetical protein